MATLSDVPVAKQSSSAAPPSRRILLVHGSRKHHRKMIQVLRSVSGEDVETRDGLGELPPDSRYGLVLADYDALSAADRARLLDAYPEPSSETRLLVLSEGQSKDDFARLFGNRMLTNLVARNDDLDAWELIVTVQKLLQRNIFGIEKYFSWGIQAKSMRVSRSQDKASVVTPRSSTPPQSGSTRAWWATSAV